MSAQISDFNEPNEADEPRARQLAGQLDQQMERARRRIREKPGESAAIAFAAGYAASVLPVGRLAFSLTTLTARALPYAVFALGCGKLWSLARECQREARARTQRG